jgi:hypothetical protein
VRGRSAALPVESRSRAVWRVAVGKAGRVTTSNEFSLKRGGAEQSKATAPHRQQSRAKRWRAVECVSREKGISPKDPVWDFEIFSTKGNLGIQESNPTSIIVKQLIEE